MMLRPVKEPCIWFVMQHSEPPLVGDKNRHYNFAKYLSIHGFRPVVFAGSKIHNSDIQMCKNGSYLVYEDAPFPFVFIKTNNYGNMLKRLLSIIEFHGRLMLKASLFPKPDVIVGSSSYPLSPYIAIRLAKKFKCKCVTEVRDLWPESQVSYLGFKESSLIIRAMRAFEHYLYVHSDAVVFTMAGGIEYLRERRWEKGVGGDIDPEKVFNINNGVDVKAFDENVGKYPYSDSDLDRSDVVKVVYAGSIRKVNDILFVVRAAECLSDDPSILFLIFGDGPYRAELEKYCRDHTMGNVKFKGRVGKEYIPSIVSKSDINLVHHKDAPVWRFGGSQNKMFDYFAAGKAIVSNSATPYSLVREYECGVERLFKTPEELAAAIVSMAWDRDARARFGDNARRAAFSFDYGGAHSEKLIEVLDRLIANEC